MIGKTISHYRIVSKLGEGGMGEVYLAEDTELDRRVALKVLPAEMADNPERLERFRREAKAVAALNHPNIVTIYSIESAPADDADQTAEVRFLTMELVEGQSLDHIVPPGGLPLSRVFEIGIPLADALAAAHERGIVHRDLKPANVMVTKGDRVKVLDFGLAKWAVEKAGLPADDEATRAATSSATLTREGTVMGTAPYMSPEQLKGRPVDGRSDIFSLGILLYEMATGHRPFKGESGIDLASSILRDAPSSVDEVRRDLPRHFGRIVQHCLEKDPRRRFQSALDVRNELDSLREETKSGVTTTAGSTPVAPSDAPEDPPSSSTDLPAGLPGDADQPVQSQPPSTSSQVQAPTSQSSAVVPATGEVVAAGATRFWKIGFVAAALVLVGLVAWYLGRGTTEKATSSVIGTTESERSDVVGASEGTPSVAVLPFADLSPDKDQEYFTDGLTEELINVLTQVEPLRVAGRTSSFQFKERTEDLRTIGEKLNVSTILEGSVRKAGDDVRISAQLVNAEDGLNLWSETYDRKLDDIFAVQDDIARSVASALEVTLLGGKQIVSHGVDPEAFNLVLRARHFLRQSSTEATATAMDLLNQALEIDPDYGAAWADLGLAYIRQGEQAQTSTESRQGFLKGIEMSEKALEIDPGLAVAMTRIAGMRMRLDFDFEGAAPLIRAALEQAPNDPRVLGNASIFEGNMGRVDEAIALLEKATQIDPLHQTLLLNLGIQNFQSGRLEDAEAAYLRLLQLNTDYLGLRGYLGDVYLWQQRPKAAQDEFEREQIPISRLGGLARAHHALGDEAAARAAIDELESGFGDDAAVELSRVYAYLGELDRAFEWLERALQTKNWGLVNLISDPIYDPLHSDPRWQPFVRRVGFPD